MLLNNEHYMSPLTFPRTIENMTSNIFIAITLEIAKYFFKFSEIQQEITKSHKARNSGIKISHGC